jgi:DNA-directed RNA polymerase specialized sigma24 family protein
VIPHLRAFGRSLSGSRDLADDLVQETLLKAWAARKRFQAGTNMRAWTFIILRNLFLSQMRRARFKGEWDDVTASKILAAPASQDRHIELGDMQRACKASRRNGEWRIARATAPPRRAASRACCAVIADDSCKFVSLRGNFRADWVVCNANEPQSRKIHEVGTERD